MSEASPSRRSWTAGLTLGAGAALALVLLGIVNYFGWKYYARFDWTGSRLYTLSEKSRNVLRDLDRDIEAVVFMRSTEELFGPVDELLSRYAAESRRFTYRVVDPEKSRLEAENIVQRYELSQINVVVFDSGEDRRVIDGSDLADYDYSGFQFGQGPELSGFKGEQAFTGAILELAESRKPKILFTVGHGELKIDDFSPAGLSQAQELLGRDNFEIEEWPSLGQPAVPDGTDLVVVAGPSARFAEPEVEVLGAYLRRGGRLLALLDPTFSEAGLAAGTGLEPLLEGYGVSVGDDIVVDPANPLPFYGAETIFVGEFEEHPITRSLRQTQVPVIFPLARSVQAGDAAEDLEVRELLRTSAEGWGETDLENLQRVERGANDLEGPVALGVAVRAASAGDGEDLEDTDLPPGGEAAADAGGESAGAAAPADAFRLVVYGDSDFATNGQLLNVGNAELLANTMNWLVERQTLLGIPPKQPEQVRLSLGAAELRTVTLLVLGGLPALAVVLGVAIYFRRRR